MILPAAALPREESRLPRKAWLSVAAVAMASALAVTLLTGMLRSDGDRSSGTATPVDRTASLANPGLAAVERAAATARASAPTEPASGAMVKPAESPTESAPTAPDPTDRDDGCTYGEAISSSLACALPPEADLATPADASRAAIERPVSPWLSGSTPASPR